MTVLSWQDIISICCITVYKLFWAETVTIEIIERPVANNCFLFGMTLSNLNMLLYS